jgi:hypothetical protein
MTIEHTSLFVSRASNRMPHAITVEKIKRNPNL